MTITSYLQKLCEHCGVESDQIEILEDETDEQITLHLKLSEQESGRFIGYHGETLEAIQRLVRLTFYQKTEKRIIINVNEYREQRQQHLAERVARIAERILETGESYTFPYLSAPDRFIVHTALGERSEFASLESISEGEGQSRLLTIRPKQAVN